MEPEWGKGREVKHKAKMRSRVCQVSGDDKGGASFEQELLTA